MTQVKTRDATASKKYFIFSLKIYPPYLPLFTAVWREGGSGSQILQLVCCYFMNEGFSKKNEGSQLCSKISKICRSKLLGEAYMRQLSLDTVHRMFHWYLQSSRLLTSWPPPPLPCQYGCAPVNYLLSPGNYSRDLFCSGHFAKINTQTPSPSLLSWNFRVQSKTERFTRFWHEFLQTWTEIKLINLSILKLEKDNSRYPPTFWDWAE